MINSNQQRYREKHIQQQLSQPQTENLHLDFNIQENKFKSLFVQHFVAYCINFIGYQDPDFIREYFQKFQTIEEMLQKFVQIISQRMTQNQPFKNFQPESETYKALQQLKKLNQEAEIHHKQTLKYMWLEHDKQRKIIKKKQNIIEQLENQLFAVKENLERVQKEILERSLQFQHQKQAIVEQFKSRLKIEQQKTNQPHSLRTQENMISYSQTRPNQFFSHANTCVTSPKSFRSAFIANSQNNTSNIFGFPSLMKRSNMKKKSAFDFSPCKKKWIQNKIHLDQMTESEQIQAYKNQIQRLKKTIMQLRQNK